MKRHLTIGAVAVGLVLSSCGGADKNATTNSAPSDTIEPPTESTPPPSAPGELPPEFLACMAEQGFDIEQGADIHSAPQRVLQRCFGALHGGTP
jgi:hypothetical protein